jgi:hypothetical protein
LCPWRDDMNFLLVTPHILTLLSSDAVTIRCPSGEKWMDRTVPVWARNSPVSPWIDGTQRRTLLSRDTEATKCPDGEKHISITPSLWALNLWHQGNKEWKIKLQNISMTPYQLGHPYL